MWVYCTNLVRLPDEELSRIRKCREVVCETPRYDVVFGGSCDNAAKNSLPFGARKRCRCCDKCFLRFVEERLSVCLLVVGKNLGVAWRDERG